ncbi:MAG TPA: hypothetical protein VE441_17315, partial [Mycobacterium sp.]|nr:hypothetical protein [Mycobacterium sp.]
ATACSTSAFCPAQALLTSTIGPTPPDAAAEADGTATATAPTTATTEAKLSRPKRRTDRK